MKRKLKTPEVVSEGATVAGNYLGWTFVVTPQFCDDGDWHSVTALVPPAERNQGLSKLTDHDPYDSEQAAVEGAVQFVKWTVDNKLAFEKKMAEASNGPSTQRH